MKKSVKFGRQDLIIYILNTSIIHLYKISNLIQNLIWIILTKSVADYRYYKYKFSIFKSIDTPIKNPARIELFNY